MQHSFSKMKKLCTLQGSAVIFDKVISKIKRWTFFGIQCNIAVRRTSRQHETNGHWAPDVAVKTTTIHEISKHYTNKLLSKLNLRFSADWLQALLRFKPAVTSAMRLYSCYQQTLGPFTTHRPGI